MILRRIIVIQTYIKWWRANELVFFFYAVRHWWWHCERHYQCLSINMLISVQMAVWLLKMGSDAFAFFLAPFEEIKWAAGRPEQKKCIIGFVFSVCFWGGGVTLLQYGQRLL
jgi:hypothetical protein